MNTFIPKGNITGMIIPSFIWERPVSLGAKVMYTLLCNYASTKNHCWPSIATLAGKLSCSVNTAKKYLQELIVENLIIKKQEQYRSSVFYMLCPKEFNSANFVGKQLDTDFPLSKIDNAVSNFDNTVSKFDDEPSNFGYINNFNKQNKETTHPLPPTGLEDSKLCIEQEKAEVGGVFPLAHDFFKLWEAYPKKEGKGLARMAFAKLRQENLLPPMDVLLKAIERFTFSDVWQKENGRFIPQMSNWLRGERWLDEGIAPSEQDKIALEKQEKMRMAQEARQADEDKKRQQEHDKKEALRPYFNIFAEKFPPPANMSMAFGTWLYLHSKGIAPTVNDVPENCSLSIISFMKEHQVRQKMSFYKQNNVNYCQTSVSQNANIILQEAV